MPLDTLQFRRALIARLTIEYGVDAIVSGRMYDDVPKNTSFPYLTFEISETPWSTDGYEGSSLRIEIHAWSRISGRRQVETLISTVYDALHNDELDLGAGRNNTLLQYLSSVAMRDPDGETYHGVITFSALTERS